MSTAVLVLALLGAALVARLLLGDLRTVPLVESPRNHPGPASGPVGGPASGPVSGPATGSVSVVIPARDEAAILPALLGSLDGLTTPVHQVVVVDDDSADATAAVARAAGAEVLPLAGPPAGWTGKAWACHRGAAATDGELLLFLDADTTLAPSALAGLLRLHDEHGGLVSVQPFHDVRRPYEQLSSYFNVMSLLASGAFGAHPERRAMAFGPCLLTSRADYRRAGGHAVVRGDILDDVGLAAAYRRAGLPVRCAVGGEAVRMRMYAGGARQLIEGWTKNFASGASAAAPGPTLGAVLWISAHHAVAVGALLALVGLATGGPPPLSAGPPVLWAVAWVGAAGQLRWILRRIGSFRWWTWAVFPLPLLAFDLLFARSVVRTLVRRSVRWRGRDVRLGAARAEET